MATFRDAWLDFCLQVKTRGKGWKGREDVHYTYEVERTDNARLEAMNCTRLAVAGLVTGDRDEIKWALGQQRWAESMRDKDGE